MQYIIENIEKLQFNYIFHNKQRDLHIYGLN